MSAKATYIWMNGKLVHWADAKVHVGTHALHYGSSIFEGIRSYPRGGDTVFFRLEDHIRRFYESARIYGFQIPYEAKELIEVCHELLARNELQSAYIRPLAFLGEVGLSLAPTAPPVMEVSVMAFEWGSYLGGDSLKSGVDIGVSSWNRFAPNTLPSLAKAGGHYLSSQLISREAKRHGYTEGIALDSNNQISEGAAENLFLVRDQQIFTPPLSCSILCGITRDSVMRIAASLGFEIHEQAMPREMLYLADELFFTGTAAEVVPIRSVDGKTVGEGKPGPITQAIQNAFFGLFTGDTPDHHGWLTKVQESSALLV